MDYGLRIDHHGGDHGPLILEAIRPCLGALRARGGRLDAALRPHWRQGPHLLVGLDADSALADAAWDALARSARDWFAQAPPRAPLDVEAFRARTRTLAALEGLPAEAGPLRADGEVERGRFAVPHPLGEACLTPPRDRFKATTLADVFDLIALRIASPAQALVDLALRMVCLQRLRWRDGLVFWPLSLQGQARASARSLPPAAVETLARQVAALRPALAARIQAAGLFDPEASLEPGLQAWVDRLQAGYDDLLRTVDAAPPDFVPGINARMLQAQPPDPATLRRSDLQTIAAMDHPTQFAYRMLMNVLYDLFPTAGFSPSQRFTVCHLVIDTLEADHPQAMARAYADGAALCR